MKRNNGISLASVMVATLLIVLLTSTITISVSKTMENANKISFASELNSIQTSIDTFYLANKEYPVTNENIILDISSVDKKDVFSDEHIENDKIILSKIDYDKIGYISLKYGVEDEKLDIYGISEITGKVYYIKGMRFGSTTYFSLTDDLKKLVSSGRNNDMFSNSPIVFIPSTTDWTNSSVSVLVKVPKIYTNVFVESGIDTYSLSREDENYYIYDIEKQGNYEVNVRFKDKNNNVKEAKYVVDNFDGEKPSINIDNHVVFSEDYESETFGYYNIINTNDDLSGVKHVKYEYGKIEGNVYNYFKTNGNLVVDNRITIKRGYEYITVYIEDNATNYDVVYIKI